MPRAPKQTRRKPQARRIEHLLAVLTVRLQRIETMRETPLPVLKEVQAGLEAIADLKRELSE